MKKLIKIFSFLLLAGALLTSCQREKFNEFEAPSEVTSNLAGTWRLTRVIQTDEDAKAKGFIYGDVNVQQMDVTHLFPYTDFRLTLNMNGNTPATFTTTPGNAPAIIRLSNGSWSLDDPKYPKEITLVNGAVTEKVVLGAYPSAANPSLILRLERRDASTNKLLISYNYQFTKQ